MKHSSIERIDRDVAFDIPVDNERPLLKIVPDFEPTHFAHGVIDVAGNPIRVTAEFTESCTNPKATLFGNGFGGFKSSGSHTREAIARSGELALTFDQPRHDNRGVFNDILNPQSAHVSTFGAVFEWLQTEDFKQQVPDKLRLDPEQQKLILLSMAGIPGTHYAHNNQNAVSDVVYVSTAGFGMPLKGLVSHPSPFKIARGIKEVHELSKVKSCELSPKLLLRSVQHHANLLRGIGEMSSCVASRVHKKAAELPARTVYIDAEHDFLIHPGEDKAQYVDAYRLLPDLGHFAVLITPERVLDTANEALRSLEKPQPFFSRAA